jgi:hypothetical protein
MEAFCACDGQPASDRQAGIARDQLPAPSSLSRWTAKNADRIRLELGARG